MAVKVSRVCNFNPGPAALPLEALERARNELTDFAGTGMSLMEMSHRSKEYEAVQREAAALLRELMGIPDGYKVLFLQGGASTQFAMVPMNLLAEGKSGAYVVTGSWAKKAFAEAKLFGRAVAAASSEADGWTRIPPLESVTIPEDAAYLHITSNETIEGTQWRVFPDTKAVPPVADMASDILSRPVDVSRFGLIYAGAQKNIGPAGVTVVIIREDLIREPAFPVPTMLRYDTHAKHDSLYNTPPAFAIYMTKLVLEWIRDNGGAAGMEARAREKAEALYRVIDASGGFYRGCAQKDSRSLMNVTFRLASEELEKRFLEEAAKNGFVGLKGHRSVGGLRASIYNGVPTEHAKALAAFMEDFMRRNG